MYLVYTKELFKISSFKKGIVHLRNCTKFILLVVLAAFLVIGVISFFYKPIYSVTLNGEMIGYSQNKSKLQEKINEYIEKGSGENVAFVEINELPQYKLCLLKRNIVANDDEIYEKVISQGTQYYKYYAITVDDEEKVYVANFSDAEEVITELKNKDSNNKDKLGIVEKYDIEAKEVTEVADCVTKLYEKKVVTVTYSSTAVAATGVNTSSKVVNLGISLIRPVSGTVTSRFGTRWGKSHKGIDIGASKGTTIVAVASGTVTVSQYGYNGGYGNYVIISHGNGIQTLYGHCTSLLVSEGQYVSQGQAIATVGSTGNSTGNHLHLEIRVNGVSQNPQNYLY
jgi:murein DD-endopeptidase MepM/ murein hydrolase activator NlpD